VIRPFAVRYTEAARQGLLRLFDHLLEAAQSAEDLDQAQYTIDALRSDIEGHLARGPFVYRKVGGSPFRRELVVPLGTTGYVVLYEIEGAETVNILAVRHQREDDYY
jgi:plasmid stabilization system protein ParE